MNFIRNPQWHDCDAMASIRTHFYSEKFIRLYGFPVTCFPTADLLKELRILKLATLEIVENRSAATVYRSGEAANRSLFKKRTFFLRGNYLPVLQAAQANQ